MRKVSRRRQLRCTIERGALRGCFCAVVGWMGGGGVKNVRRTRLVHSVFLWRTASEVYVWRAAFWHVGLACPRNMI